MYCTIYIDTRNSSSCTGSLCILSSTGATEDVLMHRPDITKDLQSHIKKETTIVYISYQLIVKDLMLNEMFLHYTNLNNI